MGQSYTTNDFILANSSILYLRFPTGGGKTVQPDWQFPPKITGNNMSGDFTGQDVKAPGVYPGFAYAGPNERYFNIETHYIQDGSLWTAKRIKQNLKIFRDYYFNLKLIYDDAQHSASIKGLLWDFAGDTETTFFIRSLNIKHGTSYISDDDANVFPLRTDLSFELVAWWNFEPLADSGGFDKDARDKFAKHAGSADVAWY